MHWSMVGWSHHHTPLDVREKLAFSTEQVVDALQKFCRQFPETEAVLLSTCNRVELYCASAKADMLPDSAALGDFVTAYHSVQFDEVSQQLTATSGPDTLKHLFMVAASLDSMIVGEAQILSQVKSAYELACQGETASTLMHRAFQRATVVARRVANETEIHRRRISVPSVAVSEIAADFFEHFDDKRILLIGAGDMGMETLRYLVDAGAKSIRIVNRNQVRAAALAEQFNAEVKPWEQLDQCLAESDLVVSTTSATEPIMSLQRFKAIRNQRGSRAVLILDLAVPRDFETAIGELSDVYLYSVDDLQQVCDRNIKARQSEWPKAEQIVDAEIGKFLSESVHRSSGPTIKKLREQAEEVKREEFERLLSKLQSRGVDAQTVKEIDIAFGRLVNKILHPPLTALRENSDSTHHASMIDALRKLFQIND
ncbi:MAG: glutamyl-tRNA reductase [Pirellulaceae bacterium]|nr:glutamyl-tRNA reductase [Pirellulaceae bacterium]